MFWHYDTFETCIFNMFKYLINDQWDVVGILSWAWLIGHRYGFELSWLAWQFKKQKNKFCCNCARRSEVFQCNEFRQDGTRQALGKLIILQSLSSNPVLHRSLHRFFHFLVSFFCTNWNLALRSAGMTCASHERSYFPITRCLITDFFPLRVTEKLQDITTKRTSTRTCYSFIAL